MFVGEPFYTDSASPAGLGNEQWPLYCIAAPTTGQNVQAWLDNDNPTDDATAYVSVKCPACVRLHLVNPAAQKTLGE